jgi:negative regulator of sigma E activity
MVWKRERATAMAEENKPEETNIESAAQKTRRRFVQTAAQVAVTAPAVALLLSATTKPAAAQITAYQASQNHILDDFTFGNTEEDIDAINLGSNFNPNNGLANQDDHIPL